MGLISLSYLNKIQDVNYWNNNWDSKLLYKKYLYLSLFLYKYFNIIFSDFSLNILIKYIININLKKGYLITKNLKKNKIKNFLIGKIWILKYQNWFLIIIKLFNLDSVKVSKKKIRDIKKKLIKYSNYNNANNFMNYKNTF